MTERRTTAGQWRFVAAIVLLATIWLLMLLGGRGPLDRAIYEALYAGHRPVLAAIARGFTALGEPTVLIGAGIASALWLWYAGHRHLPFILIAITMLGRGLGEVQKYWVGRERPDLEALLAHLDPAKTPYLIQMPIDAYRSKEKSWKLPKLK